VQIFRVRFPESNLGSLVMNPAIYACGSGSLFSGLLHDKRTFTFDYILISIPDTDAAP
jgi:hypothetical protein